MTDALVAEQAFASTFDGGQYDDAWKIVNQYRRATSYAARHDLKSGAASTALGLPQSRIQGWIDDNRPPNVVRALNVAREKGWVGCTYTDDVFAGLNALVAKLYTSGALWEHSMRLEFWPKSPREFEEITTAFETADAEYNLRHNDDGTVEEIRSSNDGIVLVRVLGILGAPIGKKADQELTLPDYLEDAPDEIRRDFLRVYIGERAVGTGGQIVVLEKRAHAYLEDLCTLIEDVTGTTAEHVDRQLTLTPDAAVDLGLEYQKLA